LSLLDCYYCYGANGRKPHQAYGKSAEISQEPV
jgi:hypothetical protein